MRVPVAAGVFWVCGLVLGGCSTPSASPSETDVPNVRQANCESPVERVPLQDAQVVGNGKASSCTEQAVRAAMAKGGTIRFDCGDAPVTITVKEALKATVDVALDGENKVTFSGAKASRVFIGTSNHRLTLQRLTVKDGSSKDGSGAGGLHTGWRGNLTIIGCTFTHNFGAGEGERAGGAISTHESDVVIVDSTFENNTGKLGGALNILLSNAKLIDVRIRNNTTTEFGGAVYIDGAGIEYTDPKDFSKGWKGVGTIHVCGATIAGNQGGKTAGGLYFCGYNANRATIERSRFSDNATDGPGGGVVAQCNGRVTIKETLISNNRARGGGGVWTTCSGDDCKPGETNAIIESSSIVDNDGSGPDTIGGGLWAAGPVALKAVTIARNRAFYGGAVAGSNNIWAQDVLIVDNEIDNPYGTSRGCGKDGLAKAQGVLEWPEVPRTQFDGPCQSDGVRGDPELAPLADHGGPTPSCALGPTSAAIGQGTACDGVDQRGTPRQAPCDVGAFQTTK